MDDKPPGWFGVLGRGVEGVVGSRRVGVGVGVVRWGASARGVSVRGCVVVGVGWRDGPWVGVVGVFVTGPGVVVGATFGVWFGAGVVGCWSPVGVGFAVGAGRVGAWASVAVALWEWNVGLADVREGESEPVWAPAPAPGMEPGVVEAEVGVGDEVSVGVGVPAGVAVAVTVAVGWDGSLPRSGEGACAAGPLVSCVGATLSEAVLMPWDGSGCPVGGDVSGVEVGAGEGVVTSASTRACGTAEDGSDGAAGAGVAVSPPPLRCASAPVPVDTSGVPDDGAASGELDGLAEDPGVGCCSL
ncbi:hypothetical protein ACOKM5_12420 [Streptomyces sp. BH097]|uniref:hypothetical protein n=1 Tax=unclassified Streptomyces TaxID=2593676 RepID=UPI003BB56BFA